MGYPMTYPRVVCRNQLTGDYSASGLPTTATDVLAARKLIAGDMRRLELDQRDDKHLALYAKAAGITDYQAYKVLSAFFTDFGMANTEWLAKPPWGV